MVYFLEIAHGIHRLHEKFERIKLLRNRKVATQCPLSQAKSCHHKIFQYLVPRVRRKFLMLYFVLFRLRNKPFRLESNAWYYFTARLCHTQYTLVFILKCAWPCDFNCRSQAYFPLKSLTCYSHPNLLIIIPVACVHCIPNNSAGIVVFFI